MANVSVNTDSILFDSLVLAVTTTSAVPATVGAAAAYAGGSSYPIVDALWQTFRQSEVQRASGGVITGDITQQTLSLFKPLDSNYTAGRYAWILGTGDQPVAGSSVPIAYIGPYLIR